MHAQRERLDALAVDWVAAVNAQAKIARFDRRRGRRQHIRKFLHPLTFCIQRNDAGLERIPRLIRAVYSASANRAKRTTRLECSDTSAISQP